MAHASLPQTIRVTVNEEPSGVLVAISPDLPGILAVEIDPRRLSLSVPERIRAWFQAEGRDVQVVREEGRVTTLSTWKVEPVEAKVRDSTGLHLTEHPSPLARVPLTIKSLTDEQIGFLADD